MLKQWESIKYTDKLTAQPVAYEVVPLNDLRRHISSPDCPCIPEFQEDGGFMMLIHNAFDGRELNEPMNQEQGH